jgi:type I restriction enzyme R subunit
LLHQREFLRPLAQSFFPIASLPRVLVREGRRVVGQSRGLSVGFLGRIDVLLAVPKPLVRPFGDRLATELDFIDKVFFVVDRKDLDYQTMKEYQRFTDLVTGEARRGFKEVVADLEHRFPNPEEIVKEKDKKEFVKLFGEYLRVENILQNFDEFASLKALQSLDTSNQQKIDAFKAEHYLTDEDLDALQGIKLPADRKIQDYRSTYNDIRDWLRREKAGTEKEESKIDWADVVFEVDLLKSQEINLDYILELIFDHNKKTKNKADLVEEVRRLIRASVGNRAKESLVVDFINQADLDEIPDKASVIEAFFGYARAEQQREAAALIAEENLNQEAARRYITASLKREYASENGTELNSILPKMSPLNPAYLSKKQNVFQRIAAFIEKFKGVGGEV